MENKDLKRLKKDELIQLCKEKGIPVNTKLKKEELIERLQVKEQFKEMEKIEEPVVVTEPVSKKKTDYALWSLLSSLISFFIGLGLFGGIAGILLYKKAEEEGETGDLLTVAKISSITVTAISSISVLIIFLVFAFMFSALGFAWFASI